MQIEDVPTVYKELLIDFEKMGFEDLTKYSLVGVLQTPQENSTGNVPRS